MASPYKRHLVSPIPPPPPPKAIDLNSSTRSTDRETGAKVTKRAFFCDVRLDGKGDEITHVLEQLGSPLAADIDGETPPHVDVGSEWSSSSGQKLDSLLEELIRTEQSYLQRVRALRDRYASPLKLFAKNPAEVIVPLYEIKSLFSNVDQIVQASECFLVDLERATTSSIGDICLRHLEEKTFEPYRTYLGNQDASQKTFSEMVRKHPGFASFIERTKYSTHGIGNIGLRELLMEPVQRIPRYTLLWQTMMRCMHPSSGQRQALAQSVAIASRIARCDPDEQTIRATVLYCLERNVEGFPATFFNHQRSFVDSIDVDEVDGGSLTSSNSLNSLSTSSSTSPSHAPSTTSHCTLFLFDDKIMIVKRHSSAVSGRKVTGLDDVSRLIKSGGGVAVLDKSGGKKDKLFYRGIVDIADIIVTDMGGGDFQLFMPKPPADQNEKWARPLRTYTAVLPPYNGLDFATVRRDKSRFVENIWAAQAKLRTSSARVMSSTELPLGPSDTFGRAKLYSTVIDSETASAAPKVICYIDEREDMSTPALGHSLLAFRLQVMPGGMIRFYHVDDAGVDDRQVLDASEVLEHMMSTIHQSGIFKFRSSTSSAPTTPASSSHRLRPSLLNLDTISRNLFGAGQTGKDPFGTSSSKRTKSSASRSSERSSLSNRLSQIDGVISAGPYQLREDQSEVDLEARLNLARNNSRSMAVLSDAKVVASREAAKKRISTESRRPTSTLGAYELGNGEATEERPESGLANRTTPSRLGSADGPLYDGTRGTSSAETGASQPLDRVGEKIPSSFEPSFADALVSRAVRPDTFEQSRPIPTTAPLRIRNKTPSPTQPFSSTGDVFTSPRVLSPSMDTPMHMSVPIGPRSPPPRGPRSPNPLRSPVLSTFSQTPGLQPSIATSSMPIPAAEKGIGSAHTQLRVVSGKGRRVSPGRETLPLRDENATPTIIPPTKRQHSEDELKPRKRSPTRSPAITKDSSPLMASNGQRRRSSGTRSNGNLTPRKVSSSTIASEAEHMDMIAAVEASRQRIADARLLIKRLKTDLQTGRKHVPGGRLDRNPSLPRSPHRRDIQRLVDLESDYSPRFNSDAGDDDNAKNVVTAIDKLDNYLRYCHADINKAAIFAKETQSENAQKSAEVDRLRAQVTRAKESQDLLRQQLAETQLEVDVIYEAFNTELDGMFNDAQLPPEEAYYALRRDLEDATTRRNELDLENKKLKRELEEANLKREQWARMLKEQGVI